MLSWTEAGAVKRPTTLQLRVQRRYPGRVRAGAPEPTRSLSRAEMVANLRYFTELQRGPRTAPCTALVLSGIGLLAQPDTRPVLREARRLGMAHVVLHAGPEDLDGFDVDTWRGLVDVLVVPLQPDLGGQSLASGAQAVASCQQAGIRVAVNTVLHTETIQGLGIAIDLVRRLLPDSVTLSFPFPRDGDQATPPTPRLLLPALESAVSALEAAGISPRLKGLPACYLGGLAGHLSPSANRFYVDADHQQVDALMFFPDVLAFHKADCCRFCSLDGSCDGFFSRWLGLAGFPPLEPVEQLA